MIASARKRALELLELHTPGDSASRLCDLVLTTLITLNVIAGTLESVPRLEARYGAFFRSFEALSVVVFTIEYLLRLWCAVESGDPRFRGGVMGRLRYLATPMAVIDLVAIAPFYAGALMSIDLRFLRILRILRIFKLTHYFSALNILLEVLRSEKQAFEAALFLLIVSIFFASGGVYLFEHELQPVAFGSIPAAMWWAVATLTTVGYGDVTPVTNGGKVFGATIAILGIGMVALPTGILANGFAAEIRRRKGIFADQVRVALEDGVVDLREREQLEHLRLDLGLSRKEAADSDPRRRHAAPGLDDAAAVSEPAKHCPNCGSAIEPL